MEFSSESPSIIWLKWKSAQKTDFEHWYENWDDKAWKGSTLAPVDHRWQDPGQLHVWVPSNLWHCSLTRFPLCGSTLSLDPDLQVTKITISAGCLNWIPILVSLSNLDYHTLLHILIWNTILSWSGSHYTTCLDLGHHTLLYVWSRSPYPISYLICPIMPHFFII